jgi:two-component system response regulator AdeR
MPADADQPQVLVVDDEPSLADIHEFWLADGYDVRTVYSGEEAVRSVANRGADVVLLDRRMPGLSGDDVTRRLDEGEYDGQVVMVTAVSPSSGIATLPVDDYVVKPVDREQLRDVVETAVLVGTYDDEVTELFGLMRRRQAIEKSVDSAELVDSEEFDLLNERIRRLQHSMDDTLDRLQRRSDTNLFERIGDGASEH